MRLTLSPSTVGDPTLTIARNGDTRPPPLAYCSSPGRKGEEVVSLPAASGCFGEAEVASDVGMSGGVQTAILREALRVGCRSRRFGPQVGLDRLDALLLGDA